jgi:hypothetical protein
LPFQSIDDSSTRPIALASASVKVVACTASSSTGNSDGGIGGSSFAFGIGWPSTPSISLSRRL